MHARSALPLFTGRFVQRLPQFLSGLETRHILGRNMNGLARFRIAASTGIVPFQVEAAKAAILYANPAPQSADNGSEHFVYSPLGLAVSERKVMLEDPVDQF